MGCTKSSSAPIGCQSQQSLIMSGCSEASVTETGHDWSESDLFVDCLNRTVALPVQL